MRRYGRTVVPDATAKRFSYEAAIKGSDHADLAGNCQSPIFMPLTGMKDRRLTLLQEFNRPWHDSAMHEGALAYIGPGFDEVPAVPRHIDIAVRCRKCEPCQRARRYHWSQRSISEIEAAPRSWFGTLTLRPAEQFRLVATARARLIRAGTDYDHLSPDEQFIEDCQELKRQLQLYLKRLRKSGIAFRYLWVIERHKSGAPHVHILLHERSPARHRVLSSQWQLGFSKFNLVAEGENAKAARYVAKYLSKGLMRPFASFKYGSPSVTKLNETNDATSTRTSAAVWGAQTKGGF